MKQQLMIRYLETISHRIDVTLNELHQMKSNIDWLKEKLHEALKPLQPIQLQQNETEYHSEGLNPFWQLSIVPTN